MEYENKGIPTHAWAELVITLEKLFSWSHPTEGIHKVICWELGKVPEQIEIQKGRKGILTKKSPGRYHLGLEEESLDVYVLRELLAEFG